MKTNFFLKTASLIIISSLAMITQSYAQAGSLDLTFNTTGKVTTAVRQHSNAKSVAIQSDGKLLLQASVIRHPITLILQLYVIMSMAVWTTVLMVMEWQ